MKIRTIEIENFGHFHAFRLEAPETALWQITGENEFGKTTLLEFIRRIFWGFPDRRSSLNPYPAVNSGGAYGGRIVLELASGETITAERLGTGKNSTFRLIRGDGRQETEEAWKKLLGISENFYRNVYAFTLDELGELKLLEQEEIRSRLYGAGIACGTLSLPALGAAFDKRADALCKLQGKNNPVTGLCAELRELDTATAAARETLPLYEAAQQREAEVRCEAEKSRQKRTALETSLRETERCLKSVPLRQKLQTAEVALAELPSTELPFSPEEVAELEKELPEYRRNHEKIIRLGEQLTHRQTQLQKLAGELTGFTDDLQRVPVPEHADRDQLRDFLRRRERLDFAREQNPPGFRRVWRSCNIAGVIAGSALCAGGLFLPVWGCIITFILAGLLLAVFGPRKEYVDPMTEENEKFDANWHDFCERFALLADTAPAEAEALFVRLAEWKKLDSEIAGAQQQLTDAQNAAGAFRQRCAALPQSGSVPEVQLAALRRELMQSEETNKKRTLLQIQISETRAGLTALFGENIPPLPGTDLHAQKTELSSELDALGTKIAELERKTGAAAAECERLRRASDPAAAANRAESCRGELRHAVREFLIWRGARALLDRAILRYERERQPEVIRRASGLFSCFTGQRYIHLHKSLTTGELRMTDTGTGQEKTPLMLSRGTFEELMLAMRLALIECTEKSNEPLPVVLDDITVNFDSHRKAAVFETLGNFAANRQLIVFSAQ